jgi:hypothetical protein
MRRLALLTAAIIGLGFPAGLGLAVYMASGSTLAPPAATAQVPTGTIARPSTPPPGVDISGNCDEAEHRFDPECVGGTTTDQTTTDETTTSDETTNEDATTEAETTTTETEPDSSGRGRGRGQGRGRGRGGGDD